MIDRITNCKCCGECYTWTPTRGYHRPPYRDQYVCSNCIKTKKGRLISWYYHKVIEKANRYINNIRHPIKWWHWRQQCKRLIDSGVISRHPAPLFEMGPVDRQPFNRPNLSNSLIFRTLERYNNEEQRAHQTTSTTN